MNKAIEKKSFFRKFSKKHHLLIGAGILAVMIVHFAIQTAFIQSEKLRSVESAMQSEKVNFNKIVVEETFVPAIEIEDEDFQAQTVNDVKVTKSVQPIPRRQEKVDATPTTNKKKSLRETKKASKAERLRRAEQILTGF